MNSKNAYTVFSRFKNERKLICRFHNNNMTIQFIPSTSKFTCSLYYFFLA